MVGTARYAAPEQARGERVGPAADVFALALVLNEVVTGEVPFASDTTIATLMARTEQPFEPHPDLGPLVPVLRRAGARLRRARGAARQQRQHSYLVSRITYLVSRITYHVSRTRTRVTRKS